MNPSPSRPITSISTSGSATKRVDEPARVLLVGDFFMCETRLVLENRLPFSLGAVGGNTPLRGVWNTCAACWPGGIHRRGGGGARWGRAPGTEHLHDLVRAYQGIRFMAATANAPFLTRPRYQTPADALDGRNAAACQTAAELHLPCLDSASVAASPGARSRCACFANCMAALLLPGRKMNEPHQLRKTLQDATCAFLENEMKLGEPARHEALNDRDSATRWKNRYHVPAADCLCIGGFQHVPFPSLICQTAMPCGCLRFLAQFPVG